MRHPVDGGVRGVMQITSMKSCKFVDKMKMRPFFPRVSYKFMASVSFRSSGIPLTCVLLLRYLRLMR